MAALLERAGFDHLVPKVQKLLDDIGERRDLTGYDWAAERIREAPITTARPGDDVLGYLSKADAAYRADRIAQADADDQADEARQRAARARPRLPEHSPAAAGDFKKPSYAEMLNYGKKPAAKESEGTE